MPGPAEPDTPGVGDPGRPAGALDLRSTADGGQASVVPPRPGRLASRPPSLCSPGCGTCRTGRIPPS